MSPDALRILVLEDDDATRQMLVRVFERTYPAVVSEATTNEEALRALREKPADLVVTDLFHPGPSGVDLIRELRQSAFLSDIPVIVLVEDTSEAKIQSLDQGADFYVVKPPSVGELEARVRVLLRRGLSMQYGEAALQVRTQDLADNGALQRV